MKADSFFGAMRFISSRTNANDFMEWFFPNKPFDDYHMNKWVQFRDNPIAFWCHSDAGIRTEFEKVVNTIAKEGKK